MVNLPTSASCSACPHTKTTSAEVRVLDARFDAKKESSQFLSDVKLRPVAANARWSGPTKCYCHGKAARIAPMRVSAEPTFAFETDCPGRLAAYPNPAGGINS